MIGNVIIQAAGSPATAGEIDLGVCPCDGEIVDVIHTQRVGGVGGTHAEFTVDRIRATAATSVLKAGTKSKITLAVGNGYAVDAKGAVDLPAGCVRPVLSETPANLKVQKGDALVATATYTGVYTTAPTTVLAVVVKPSF